MSSSEIYGLVLAGGQSRRMGRDKALLQRDGKSQLAHIVELLGRVTERVFVSARSEQRHEAERSRFAQIIDRYDDIGPIAGILSAMHEHPQVDWLVVACDLPNIDEATLRFLLDNRSAGQPFTAFKSSHDKLPEPMCALYRSGSESIVRRFVDDGVNCPRKILMRSDTLLLEQPNPQSLDNINTPDDLAGSILGAAS
ncbi:MAG: NTP transferase domain-containing protein [Proteobacteria bacterium]|nr:NTP transferase domain-containing protein [Pseudomonadota bacterium]